jgi:hypothetical protein
MVFVVLRPQDSETIRVLQEKSRMTTLTFDIVPGDFDIVHSGRLDDGKGLFGLWVSSTFRFGVRCYDALIEQTNLRPLIVGFRFEDSSGELFGAEDGMTLTAKGEEFFRRSSVCNGPWILSRGWLITKRNILMLRTDDLRFQFRRHPNKKTSDNLETHFKAEELKLGTPSRLIIDL